MDKQWFVLQTLVGQEKKVLDSINARIKIEEMEDYIGEVVIPMEKVQETKDGKKRTVNRKVFPGWVLIKMALYESETAESRAMGARERKPYDRTWNFLRETKGVVGTWLTKRPMPLRQDEVDAILTTKPSQAAERPRPKFDFKVGETVKIKEGPFASLTGTVTMTDPDKGKLRVEVSVFNRMVPVDADSWQVEKLTEEEFRQDAPQI